MTRKRTRLLLVVLYLAAGLHVWSVGGSFVWDDRQMIVENPEIRDLRNVPAFFTHNYFGDRGDSELFRPLVNVSLAVDFAAWGSWGAGDGNVGPHGFHATNVLLHLLAGALLYALLLRITSRPLLPELGALLFLVHPASAEPVGWIVGRGDLLALVFVLSTIHLHLAGRRRPWLAALAPATYLLGLFSKLSAAPAPLLILLLEGWFFGLRGRGIPRRDSLVRYGAYLAPVLIYAVVRAGAMGSLAPRGPGQAWRDPPILAAAATSGAILFRYAFLFLVPTGMCADYSADPVFRTEHLAEVGSRLPVILMATAVPVLVILALLQRRRWPWASFGALWFFVGLIPVSQLVLTGNVMADRFLYLPAAGACGALAAGLLALPRRRVMLAGLTVLTFAALTFRREAVWRDEVAMNRDVLAARNYPESSDAWTRLGLALDRRGDLAGAAGAYDTAIDLEPENRYALMNLGALRYQAGDLREARRLLGRGIAVSRRADRIRASLAYDLSLVPTAEYRSLLPALREEIPGLAAHSPELEATVRRLRRITFEVAKLSESIRILEEHAIPCARAPVLASERLGDLRGRLKRVIAGVR